VSKGYNIYIRRKLKKEKAAGQQEKRKTAAGRPHER
jgi:hypothetical protein